MNLTIHLTDDDVRAFEAKASAEGLNVQDWLTKVGRAQIGSAGQTVSAHIRSGENRPIWDVIVDNMKDVPPEEFAKLPKDGAAQVDHYLYGHPKR